MGLPFAHGTQKRWIVAALQRLPPSQFGDNPRQVSFTKHARPLVRELVGRVRNVVLMNVYLDLGNPGGSGFWVGGIGARGGKWGS